MKLIKMTATFGALEQAVLVPGEGLTIITAPNEAGKSTWAGFLRAMLYGINTRERDKAGFLADKTRYQPWSGAPMFGELLVEWQGQVLTIRRFPSKSSPFGGFEAVYTASGDPVPGLTGANLGQTLTGVSQEVFVRTALVGQNSTFVTAAPELEQRIAALATSGQEDVSFSATQRILRDWRNRRRSNRSNGLIPELERELAHTAQSLREMELARLRQREATAQLARLAREKSSLSEKAAAQQHLAQEELRRRRVQAQSELKAAQEAFLQLPCPVPGFDGLTSQQAWELAERQQEEERQAREGYQQACLRRQQLTARRQRLKTALLVSLGLGLCGLVAAILGLVLQRFPISLAGLGCALVAAAFGGTAAVRRSSVAQAIRQLPFTPPPPEDSHVMEAARAYQQWLSQRLPLEEEIRRCQARLDSLFDLNRQAGDRDPAHLTPHTHAAREIAARLAAVEQETRAWQSQLDQAVGALQSDPLALEAKEGQLKARLAQRTLENQALELALSVLETANNTLRQRFSPAINQVASQFFSALTGQKYTRLSLSRDLSAQAASGPDPLRSALYLSAGTFDQLYLAVRLAMCQLTVPGIPLLLDDALSAFDDQRAALALNCLRELGGQRQILLFSCHGREAQWAKAHGIPVLSLSEANGSE